jgi:hypothetical protein
VQVPHSSVRAVSVDTGTGSYRSPIPAHGLRPPLTYPMTVQAVDVNEQCVPPYLRSGT